MGEKRTLRCRVIGCRWWFGREEETVLWICERCGREGGRRAYASPEEARRFAAAFNRGRPGPPTGLLVALSGTVVTKDRAGERKPGPGS